RDLLGLMGTAGALGWTATNAQAPEPSTVASLANVVERNDEAVRRLLPTQITDQASPNRGSIPDPFGLHSAGSASGVVETLAASFVHPASKFHHDSALLDRIR